MGQEEVLEILRRKKVVTAREVAETLKINIATAWRILSRLAKSLEIEKVVIEPEEAEKFSLPKVGRHIIWRLKENLERRYDEDGKENS